MSAWPDIPKSLYQGVMAVHVLDHLLYPTSDLRAVRMSLEDGGVFSAVVHNERSALRFVLGKHWPPYCLQHPQLFSPRSLTFFAKMEGFQDIRIRRTTNWFSLQHIGETVVSLAGMKSRSHQKSPRFGVPMRLGNIQMVARKAG